MYTSKKTPYEFIQRNYRDPGPDAGPVQRWVPHPENARAICATLLHNGIPEQDLEDAIQDVLVRELRAFAKGTARLPADLREMKAFSASIAKKFAMATQRRDKRREELGHAGICEADADEYTPLEYGAPIQRDPVDAGRQLEIAAQMFRDGLMPEHGVDILEGVAAGCTYKEIAADLEAHEEGLEINEELVRWRMREMERRYRSHLVKLGLHPEVTPLRMVASEPSAIEVLRKAA